MWQGSAFGSDTKRENLHIHELYRRFPEFQRVPAAPLVLRRVQAPEGLPRAHDEEEVPQLQFGGHRQLVQPQVPRQYFEMQFKEKNTDCIFTEPQLFDLIVLKSSTLKLKNKRRHKRTPTLILNNNRTTHSLEVDNSRQRSSRSFLAER